MPERTVNPRDSVDLVLLLQSYGETIGTLYPRAYVYDNSDTEITNSPFDLTLVANNLYTLSNAFQVEDSGMYKVVYVVFTDAGHTLKSASHGEVVDTINVKIQSTTGLGGYGSMKNGGADVIVDMDPIFKAIKKMEKDFNKKVAKLQKAINKDVTVNVEKPDLSLILENIEKIKSTGNDSKITDQLTEFKSSNKKELERVMAGIKKNRSTIIKSKFDKGMIKPILQSVADSDYKTIKSFKNFEITLSKMIDKKNEEANKKFNDSLDNGLEKFIKSLNTLNESIRKKLKFTLDGLRTLLFVGKQGKQDINITLKKNE